MHYTHAILRIPASTCGDGLTTAVLGKPDAQLTRLQFNAYVSVLSDLGLTVTVLPASPAFPDGHFVEDTAVVMPELAIITNPGAPSRAGETASMEPELARFKSIAHLSSGHMDGGDVLMIDKRFFVGLSNRTDLAGIAAFKALVEPLGYQVDVIEVNGGLHLKSLVNYVGRNTLLLDKNSARHRAFADYEHLIVSQEEEYAGNTLWINDTLITPEGYGHTLQQLQQLGLNIITTPPSEIKKMDGGLTCLSLRF